MVLENHCALKAWPGNFAVGAQQTAFYRQGQPGDQVEQGGLAAARNAGLMPIAATTAACSTTVRRVNKDFSSSVVFIYSWHKNTSTIKKAFGPDKHVKRDCRERTPLFFVPDLLRL